MPLSAFLRVTLHISRFNQTSQLLQIPHIVPRVIIHGCFQQKENIFEPGVIEKIAKRLQANIAFADVGMAIHAATQIFLPSY